MNFIDIFPQFSRVGAATEGFKLHLAVFVSSRRWRMRIQGCAEPQLGRWEISVQGR
jgi:hypothetical protein